MLQTRAQCVLLVNITHQPDVNQNILWPRAVNVLANSYEEQIESAFF